MRIKFIIIGFSALLVSCEVNKGQDESSKTPPPLVGTWQLISGTVIEKGDTTVSDYTKDVSFIKIINETHFAFMLHDLPGGEDNAAVFGSGAGRYDLVDSTYTEHLEYCNDKKWEGHDFVFTVTIKNDTLVQRGLEEVESAGIKRLNIEKYFRVKK